MKMIKKQESNLRNLNSIGIKILARKNIIKYKE